MSRGRYQIEHWSNDGTWEPMQNGAAAHVWQPRESLAEAVDKAHAWAGIDSTDETQSIPAMQVRDLYTGEVLWRASGYYPDAGPPITTRITRSEQLTLEVTA